jgi:hypothetical protein
MHCANKNFGDLCVLPPYNNVWAVLIQRGDDPQIVGSAYAVNYSFPANTYSVGKTDFWSYEDRLFGVSLADNIGLTGNGLSGTFEWSGGPSGHYEARGIPITPYDDVNLGQEQPYQLATLEAYDGGTLLASTEIVVPISNEMMCADCHVPEQGETVEHAILRKHDELSGTDLVNSRPVLCATCHGSNALGMAGDPELDNLSLAMHSKHAEQTNDCYQCHPGSVTRCLRGAMGSAVGETVSQIGMPLPPTDGWIPNARLPRLIASQIASVWSRTKRCSVLRSLRRASRSGTGASR